MTKRIAVIGGETTQRSVIAPELQTVLASDDELTVYPSKVGAFPYTALEVLLQEVGHTGAAHAAADDGCSAVLIDSVGDYGLAAMRASLSVPAFGPGESGMAAAAAGGRRFAIVTVWPASMNFILEGRLRAYGHEVTSLFNIGSEDDIAGRDGPDAYLSRIRNGHESVLNAASRAITAAAADGADAVMLGCTCMSGIAATLASAAPVPVVNPLAAAVAAAAAAGPIAAPQVREGRSALLRSMVEAVSDSPRDACPVCIFEAQP